MKTCPQCASSYGYFMDTETYACPECSYEWNPATVVQEKGFQVKDANGNFLQNGDSVIMVKSLKVKGASGPLKAGTKVRNIRLVEGDHNISCKISGFGAMALKSEFVKKSS